MMTQKNYRTHAVGLFLLFLLLGGVHHYSLYREDVEVIEDQTKTLLRSEAERVSQYLESYSDVLKSYKSMFGEEKSFDKEKFFKMANRFNLHFKDTLAFNFVDSSYEIKVVYPEEKNKNALGKNLTKHPDDLVRDFFQKGLSKSSLTFLPPVSIYQGGSAVIFYVPVSFRDKSHGWINIVLLSKNLFKKYEENYPILKHGFSVLDKKTNRNFFGSQETQMGEHIYSYPGFLFNRDVLYNYDLSKELNEQKVQSIKEYFVFSFILVILLIIFILYSNSREEVFKQLLDVKNESNLLRVLVHDLSNPIQIVSIGLQNLKIRKRDGVDKLKEEEFIDSMIENQSSSAEIIRTVRELYSKGLAAKDSEDVNLYEVFKKLISGLKGELESLDIKLILNLNPDFSIPLRLDKNAFKNHVLRNLLVNAIKFSDKGGRINIFFEGGALKIENSCSNLDSNHIKELNMMKFQESNLDNQLTKSLGLGLYIAKVFCYHGKISFDISENSIKGTVVASLRF